MSSGAERGQPDNLDDPVLAKAALEAQKNEITEHHVYRRLSQKAKTIQDRRILERISKDELDHYFFWRQRTKQSVPPNVLKLWLYYLAARFFGITFAMKLMEKGEGQAQIVYGRLAKDVPGLGKIIEDEDKHEAQLVDLVDEDHLNYVGSVLRGLNAAIVELVGTLAGLVLVFHDSYLIAIAGLVAGIATTMSLVGTDYLGAITDSLFRNRLSPDFRRYLKGPVYSGATSLGVAFLLTMPFLVFGNKYVALINSVAVALVTIFLFNFYVSVTKSVSFLARVREMLAISLGTAGLTFVGGYLVSLFLSGLDRIR